MVKISERFDSLYCDFRFHNKFFHFLSVFRKNASSATPFKKFGASYSKFTVHWSIDD